MVMRMMPTNLPHHQHHQGDGQCCRERMLTSSFPLVGSCRRRGFPKHDVQPPCCSGRKARTKKTGIRKVVPNDGGSGVGVGGCWRDAARPGAGVLGLVPVDATPARPIPRGPRCLRFPSGRGSRFASWSSSWIGKVTIAKTSSVLLRRRDNPVRCRCRCRYCCCGCRLQEVNNGACFHESK